MPFNTLWYWKKYLYPINPYMDTSVCRSGNAITVCKYGKSSCHGDCFIITGMAN